MKNHFTLVLKPAIQIATTKDPHLEVTLRISLHTTSRTDRTLAVGRILFANITTIIVRPEMPIGIEIVCFDA